MNIFTAMDMAMHFQYLNEDRISFYANLPDVAMSYNALCATASFFNNRQYRFPYAGELILIDAFYNSLRLSPDHYSSASISTDDSHVASAVSELMKAHAEIHPERKAPATVGEAFFTAIEATSHQKAGEFSPSEKRVFVAESDSLARLTALTNGYVPEFCENGICVAQNDYSFAGKKPLKLSAAHVAIIIYPRDFSNTAPLESFTKTMLKNSSAELLFASEGKNAFSRILSLSSNMAINANELIPYGYNGTPDLFTVISSALFSNSKFGDSAITVITKKKNLHSICMQAVNLGLNACPAIEFLSSPIFKTTLNGNTISELFSDVFKSIGIKTYEDVKLPPIIQEGTSVAPASNVIYAIPECGEKVYSSTVSLSNSAYANTVLALVSPVIHAAYDGANFKNSCFRFSVKGRFNLTDSNGYSASYSSIAALYDSLAALGISLDCSDVSVTDGEPSLSVILRVSSFEEKATLVSSFSPEALINKALENVQKPNFSLVLSLLKG